MIVNSNELTFSYGKHVVLDHVSFEIKQGESVGIIGCNGVGKSTLLKLLCGIELNYEGALAVNGLSLDKKNIEKIREKTGYVFQDSESQLFMTTVYEDVAFAPENFGYTKDEVKKRTMEALEKVHMEQYASQKIYKLSGGQKKLASIATVLSMEPEILLMDEPSVALDPQNRRNLIRVLNELHTTKIIASHDLDFVYDTCQRVILLTEGKVAADGLATEILTNRELLEKNGLELPLSFSRSI